LPIYYTLNCHAKGRLHTLVYSQWQGRTRKQGIWLLRYHPYSIMNVRFVGRSDTRNECAICWKERYEKGVCHEDQGNVCFATSTYKATKQKYVVCHPSATSAAKSTLLWPTILIWPSWPPNVHGDTAYAMDYNKIYSFKEGTPPTNNNHEDVHH
jgi:hypothetical protein